MRSSVPGEDGSGEPGWPRGVGAGAEQGRRLGRGEGEASKRQVGTPEVDRRQAEGSDIRAYTCLYRNRLSQSLVGTLPSFISRKMKWICLPFLHPQCPAQVGTLTPSKQQVVAEHLAGVRHWGACGSGGHGDGDHGNDHGIRMSVRTVLRGEPCSKSSKFTVGSQKAR